MKKEVVLKLIWTILKNVTKFVVIFFNEKNNYARVNKVRKKEDYEWSYAKGTYVVRDTTFDKYEK